MTQVLIVLFGRK